jgi:hypothetical protein
MMEKKKFCKAKIFGRIGTLFIIGSLFLIRLVWKSELFFDAGSVLLFLGILFSIPDYWLFFLNRKRKNDKLSCFWLTKFLGICMILVLMLVYFFVRLYRSTA